jgi:hypothetical protein
MNLGYSIARQDPSWQPSFKTRPALYLVPRNGISRHSSDWRPNLGQNDGSSQSPQSSAAGTANMISAFIGLGVTLTNLLVKAFSGCGQSCTLTSDEANQVEQALQQNLAAYLAIPNGERTKSIQAAALANFDNTWAQLVKYCGSGSFGSAGQRCVTDREQGSCAYKTSPGGWQQQSGTWTYVYPGANGSGSTCWNWFVAYRDSIANDPTVVPDAVSGASSQVSSAVGQIFSGSSTPAGTSPNLTPLLLIGGAVLLAMVLL